MGLELGADMPKGGALYLETEVKHRCYTRRAELGGVPGQPIAVTDARDWMSNNSTRGDPVFDLSPAETVTLLKRKNGETTPRSLTH